MIREESGRSGADQNAGPTMGSSQGGSMGDGQSEGRGNIVDTARDKIQQLASQARQTANKQAESRFSTGKDRATQTIGSVAQTLHSSGQQLRDQQQIGIGKWADQAANKLEEVSRYLENASLNDVATRVEDFARREPAMFIGSAVALGFLGARFLKSSQRNQQGQMNMQQGFRGNMQSSGGMQAGNLGMQQGSQGVGGAWQGSDRDVTSPPQREWTNAGNESQRSTPIDNTAGRTGRA